MNIFKDKSSVKNLYHRYRMSIVNEESFKEIAVYTMTGCIVYFVKSLLFVPCDGLMIVLIAFTPLKYYVPGCGNSAKASGYALLQQKTDSLKSRLRLQLQYNNAIRSVLKREELPTDTFPESKSNSN